MGVGKLRHRNRRCKVLLTYDLRCSSHQSSVGTVAGLRSGIRDWASRLNCTPG